MLEEEILYRPKLKSTFIALIVVIVPIGIAVAVKNPRLTWNIIFIGAIILFVFFHAFFSKRVKLIKLNTKGQYITFEIQKYFKKKELRLNLNSTLFTYKNETGARGTSRPALKIYIGNKEVLEIVPGISGWSDRVLEALSNKIDQTKNVPVTQDKSGPFRKLLK